jgi:hypothetical protein
MSEKINSVYAGSTDKDRQFLLKMKELEQEFKTKVEQGSYNCEVATLSGGERYSYRRITKN